MKKARVAFEVFWGLAVVTALGSDRFPHLKWVAIPCAAIAVGMAIRHRLATVYECKCSKENCVDCK